MLSLAPLPPACRHLEPVQACRACGCWQHDACLDENGEPCHRVERDLCSCCAGAGGEQQARPYPLGGLPHLIFSSPARPRPHLPCSSGYLPRRRAKNPLRSGGASGFRLAPRYNPGHDGLAASVRDSGARNAPCAGAARRNHRGGNGPRRRLRTGPRRPRARTARLAPRQTLKACRTRPHGPSWSATRARLRGASSSLRRARGTSYRWATANPPPCGPASPAVQPRAARWPPSRDAVPPWLRPWRSASPARTARRGLRPPLPVGKQQMDGSGWRSPQLAGAGGSAGS